MTAERPEKWIYKSIKIFMQLDKIRTIMQYTFEIIIKTKICLRLSVNKNGIGNGKTTCGVNIFRVIQIF